MGSHGRILLLLALLPVRSPAQEVALTPAATRYDLGLGLLLLEDADRALTAAEALARAEDFVPSTDAEPSMGFSPSVWWARFALRSEAPGVPWVLELAYPPLDRLELYEIRGSDAVLVGRAGDSVGVREAGWPGRTPRFRLDLPTGQTRVYLLRVDGGGYTTFPLRVWEMDTFLRHDRVALLLVGMFFGLMLVMVVYNAVIFAAARDVLYLYYILFVLAHLAFEAGYLGVSHEYLWPSRAFLVNQTLLWGAALAVLFAALFTRRFLWEGRSIPWVRITLDLCVALGVGVVASTVLLAEIPSLILVNTSLVACSALFIACAVAALMRGYTPARIYLVAWTSLLLGVILIGLRNFRVLPAGPVTGYALQVGSIFEVVLLSLALAERIAALRRESAENERKLRLSRERELKATEEKLYFDPLTGLPNRSRLLVDTRDLKSPVLFLVNIDQFKHINDFYGNRVGDAVIQELRGRLVATPWSRPVSHYRLHADEYAVVADSPTTPEECLVYGQKLVEACRAEPISVDGQTLRLAVSVGIAREGGSLLEQADMALAEARRGRKSVAVYDPAMQTRKQYEHNLRWVGLIREALKADRILPYFQPIRHNATGAVRKYESLARLVAPDGRVVSPGEFLPVAKASQIYAELSCAVIRKDFEILAGVEDQISINISVEDIEHEETVALIRENLRRHRVGPRVVFEILESEGIHRYDVVSGFIESMKAEGCSIAIDDFGTGYSNFEHILRLKVDYLKVDASLIRNLDHDAPSRAIVRTIQQFALELGIETIAEYVHSAAVQAEVEKLGLHYSQGYHVGPPRPRIA